MKEISEEVHEYLERESDIAESEPLPAGEDAAYEVFDNSVMPPAFRKKILED